MPSRQNCDDSLASSRRAAVRTSSSSWVHAGSDHVAPRAPDGDSRYKCDECPLHTVAFDGWIVKAAIAAKRPRAWWLYDENSGSQRRLSSAQSSAATIGDDA